MSKKAPNLVAGLVAVAALAVGPLPVASAEVVWHCPPGVRDHNYCTKEIHCNKRGTKSHDCRREDR